MQWIDQPIDPESSSVIIVQLRLQLHKPGATYGDGRFPGTILRYFQRENNALPQSACRVPQQLPFPPLWSLSKRSEWNAILERMVSLSPLLRNHNQFPRRTTASRSHHSSGILVRTHRNCTVSWKDSCSRGSHPGPWPPELDREQIHHGLQGSQPIPVPHALAPLTTEGEGRYENLYSSCALLSNLSENLTV